MKKTILSMAVASALMVSAGSALAGEGAANVGFVSDYVFRGFTQTDNGPSIQGGYDYDLGNGLAVGIWGATGVNFGTVDDEIEYDLYASYSGKAGSMDYSIGYTNYMYTESDAVGEVALGAGFGAVSVGYYVASSISATYVELGYDLEAGGVGIGLHYGSADYDGFAVADYSVTAGKAMGGVDVSLTYAATDVDGVDPVVALGVSKSF